MSVMQQDGQAEVEVVTGVVSGIITKGTDKWQIAVKSDPQAQYSKNLWTKDFDLVNQLQQLIGATMTFQCGVSHWNLQDGTPVRSLWINGAGPAQEFSQAVPAQRPGGTLGGTQAVAQAMHPQQVFQPQPQPQMQQVQVPQAQTQGYDDDPKQGKIHRQTASKVAGILLGYLPPEERTLDTLLTVSERLVAYYDNGMPDTVAANDGPDTGEFPSGLVAMTSPYEITCGRTGCTIRLRGVVVAITTGSYASAVTLTHQADFREEVETWLAELEAA